MGASVIKWCNKHAVLGCLHGNHPVETVLLASTDDHIGGTRVADACVSRLQETAQECQIIQK